MNDGDIHKIVEILSESNKRWAVPIVTEVANNGRDPFRVLISCILSLRTKDDVTRKASSRLFELADTPEAISRLDVREIERAIYPVGFYRRKAREIKDISIELVERFDGRVPDDIDELLRFKGVGRKTANLVVTLGYDKLGICVDTHVHRVSNRLGYVRTKTPEETEFALRDKLPLRYWKIINDLLVTHGQNICKPVAPLCSKCPIYLYCDRVGVVRSR